MMNKLQSDEFLLKRSLISSGDRNRLWSVMRKASRGETITFGVIGGSITQGCNAETKAQSYAELVCDWWKKTFSWTPVNYINAGVGATDSYIGVHRVRRDMLVHRPDVVIVEFSVNDTRENINAQTYKSLVRQILLSENAPAVILLFTVTKNGSNLQEVHALTGAEFALPMISLANAVFPEIEKGSVRWEDLFTDEVHPSSAGHELIAHLVNSYLDSVYSDAFNNEPVINSEYDCTEDKYENALILDNRSVIPCENTGFEKTNVSFQFPNGWISDSNAAISFETECSNIGILYYRTIDGDSGFYSVYIDGEKKDDLNGDFSGGWGNFADYSVVLTSDRKQKHIIQLKPSENLKQGKFTLLGLCIS